MLLPEYKEPVKTSLAPVLPRLMELETWPQPIVKLELGFSDWLPLRRVSRVLRNKHEPFVGQPGKRIRRTRIFLFIETRNAPRNHRRNARSCERARQR